PAAPTISDSVASAPRTFMFIATSGAAAEAAHARSDIEAQGQVPSHTAAFSPASPRGLNGTAQPPGPRGCRGAGGECLAIRRATSYAARRPTRTARRPAWRGKRGGRATPAQRGGGLARGRGPG